MATSAMGYLHACMARASGATCRSAQCATSRIGAVYEVLQAAGLYPWPKANNGPTASAGGRSVHQIVSVLENCCRAVDDLSSEGRVTPDPIVAAGMADPCSGCADLGDEAANFLLPLLGLYMDAIFGIGEKLVRDMKYPGAL